MRRKTARIMLTTIPAKTIMSNNLGSLLMIFAPRHKVKIVSSITPDVLSR